MISNRLCFSIRMIKDRLFQNIWVSALFFVSCLFTLPIQSALIFQRYISDVANKYITQDNAGENISRILGQGNAFFKLTLIMAALVMGWTFFSYIHSKKQVDLYHSLPISRIRIFVSNFFAGNISFAIIYIVNIILACVVISVVGFGAEIDYMDMLKTFMINILYFNSIFSVSILAGLIAGTSLIHVLITFVILEYIQMLAVLFSQYMKFFFKTFYANAIFTDKLLMNLSPVTNLFSETLNLNLNLLGEFVALIAIIILNIYIFNRRPSESAGKAIINKKLEEIVKYLVLIAGTMAGGLIFYEVGQSNSWMIFGLIFSAFIGHCILECLLSFDMKNIFKNKGKLSIFMLVFALGFTALDYDVAGYDKKIPEFSDVESVSINPFSVDPYTSYNSHDYDEIDKMESVRLSNPDTIKAIIEIADISVQNQKNYKSSSSFVSIEHFQVAVKFNLKDGKNIIRYYKYPPLNKALSIFSNVFDTHEFKYRYYPLMNLKSEEIQKASVEFPGFVNPDNKNSYASEIKGNEKMRVILNAAQHDFLKIKAADLRKNSPVAIITFTDYEEQRIDVPVFKEYENTLKILSSLGYTIEERINLDSVEYIELYEYKEDAKEEINYAQTYESKEPVKILREKDEIKDFFTEFISSYNISYNSFVIPDSNKWAIVYFKGDNNSGYDFIYAKDIEI